MSFLQNDAVSPDAAKLVGMPTLSVGMRSTFNELCTGADTIKQKYVSFVLVDLQK